jgi:hypothetical protein
MSDRLRHDTIRHSCSCGVRAPGQQRDATDFAPHGMRVALRQVPDAPWQPCVGQVQARPHGDVHVAEVVPAQCASHAQEGQEAEVQGGELQKIAAHLQASTPTVLSRSWSKHCP